MDQRLVREAAFFDNQEYSAERLPQATVQRYLEIRKPFLSPEYPFSLLGDLEGKRVLEIGCGNGGNAVMLALKGATVVGIDISSRAVAAARERASRHGVGDRVRFLCTPLEAYLESSRERFDIIYGQAVLHHLLPVLDPVMAGLLRLTAKGARFICSEPVSMARWLRRLRLLLPIPVHGTPDERPLEPRDIAVIRRYFPNLRLRYFNFLVRIADKFLLAGDNYELTPSWRRSIYDLAARLDRVILRVPGLQCLASGVVMSAHRSG